MRTDFIRDCRFRPFEIVEKSDYTVSSYVNVPNSRCGFRQKWNGTKIFVSPVILELGVKCYSLSMVAINVYQLWYLLVF